MLTKLPPVHRQLMPPAAEEGRRNIVEEAIGAPEKVTVSSPSVPTATERTALPFKLVDVARPACVLLVGSEPLDAKYSPIAVLPEVARDRPSVTLARTV